MYYLCIIILMNMYRKLKNIEHRNDTIRLYESQLEEESGTFMKIVLTEAIRKLNENNLPTTKIENWVVKLEKDFRKI